MMYSSVLSDIKQLVGVKLKSIRAGADITLTLVSERDERIELKDSSGNQRSRSLMEVRRVWEKLSTSKAVHVDSVLAGSGSSRNQPETILANLPYIEWLIINGRKHITFVGRNSHQLGTLKEMDAMAAHELRDSLNTARRQVQSALLVVENLNSVASFLESVTGLSLSAIEVGIYGSKQPDREIWIAAQNSTIPSIPTGAYITLLAREVPLDSTEVKIAGNKYYLVCQGGFNFLIYTI